PDARPLPSEEGKADERDDLVATLVEEQRRTNALLETMCVLLARSLHGRDSMLDAKTLQALLGIGKTKYHQLVKAGHLRPQHVPDSDVHLYPVGTAEALVRRAAELRAAL
ncbi:MAG: hypothetical protein AAFP15_20080, partial [Bacteroidota bacterium]